MVLKEKRWNPHTEQYHHCSGFAGGGYKEKDGRYSDGSKKLFNTGTRELYEETEILRGWWVDNPNNTFTSEEKFSHVFPEPR